MIPTLAETVIVHHGHWFPWFPLVPLAFVAAWFALFWLVFRRRWRVSGPSAEAVLAERFARGEIDEREFRERRSVLRRKD